MASSDAPPPSCLPINKDLGALTMSVKPAEYTYILLELRCSARNAADRRPPPPSPFRRSRRRPTSARLRRSSTASRCRACAGPRTSARRLVTRARARTIHMYAPSIRDPQNSPLCISTSAPAQNVGFGIFELTVTAFVPQDTTTSVLHARLSPPTRPYGYPNPKVPGPARSQGLCHGRRPRPQGRGQERRPRRLPEGVGRRRRRR